MALEAFVEHVWETQLLRLTLEDLEIDSVSDLDLKAKCQLCFYLASSFLIRGQRAAARPLFEVSALTQVQCTEAVLAGCETTRPEARTLTLTRVLSTCQHSLQGIGSVEDAAHAVANFLRYATVAVEILEDIPESPRHSPADGAPPRASGWSPPLTGSRRPPRNHVGAIELSLSARTRSRSSVPAAHRGTEGSPAPG